MTQPDAPVYPSDFKPPQPKIVRFRKYAVGLVAAVVALCLIATGVVFVRDWWSGCGQGLTMRGDECVGVTDLSDLADGSWRFDPSLQPVEKLIRDENRSVTGPAVTVAVLMPMTTNPTTSQSAQQTRSHVEGAYIAQHQANKDPRAHPKIRLVLANEGSAEQEWEHVTGQLVELAQQHRLVAVTGLGVSVRETVWGARKLSDAGIPMIGSVITADELNKVGGQPPPPNAPIQGIQGLSRVSVRNDTEVQALAKYFEDEPIKPLIVADRNYSDFYTAGLHRDFEKHFNAKWRAAGSNWQPYDGAEPGAVGELEDIASRLCNGTTDTVLYSGRASLLTGFIEELRRLRCAEHPITVVTGSDGSTLQDTLPPKKPGQRDVRIVYAALADRSGLQGTEAEFRTEFTNRFREDDLNNGWAIMGYDAMMTAITAIKAASGPDGGLPGPEKVWHHLEDLNSADNGVDGAVGRFEIDKDTGDPVGREIPIMQIGPGDEPAHRVDTYYQPNPRCPGYAHQC